MLQMASEYGSLENYWKANKFFMNVKYWEDTDIIAKLYLDEKIGGNKDPDWTKTFELLNSSSSFSSGISGFGMGVWGGIEAGPSMVLDQDDLFSEYYEYDSKIFKTFNRAYLELTGSSSNQLEIRGVGMNIEPTSRQIRNIQMYS